MVALLKELYLRLAQEQVTLCRYIPNKVWTQNYRINFCNPCRINQFRGWAWIAASITQNTCSEVILQKEMNINLMQPLDPTTDLQEDTKARRVVWWIQEDIAK